MLLKSIFHRRGEMLPWQGISMGQTHSCANYIFFYDVRTDKKGRLIVTGECRDKRGRHCVKERGVRLKRRTLAVLENLRLEELPEEEKKIVPPEFEEVILLDASERYFTLILPDGRQERKVIPEAMFCNIAEQFNAYIVK